MNKFFNTFSLIKKEFLIFSSIFLISLFLRLFDVSSRAMHHDESLHVFYSWKLFEGLGYSHNPMMHGPLQMELTSIFFSIMGDSDFSGRLLYVACGGNAIFFNQTYQPDFMHNDQFIPSSFTYNCLFQ